MTALQEPPLVETLAAPVREVTIRPIPRREPPFDDEIDDYRVLTQPDGSPLPRVVLGPWDQPLPFGAAELEAPSPLRLVAPRDPFAARPTARRSLPDPEAWARRLLVTMFEIVGGRRPARQLGALASASVCGAFTTTGLRTGRLGRLAAATPSPQIRSVHVCEPADGIAELALTLAVRGRVHAVAIRLEGLDGRWRCVKLEVG
ncbi:Rv3235 family protein [Jatrophihabitans sp. YIM 134969]